MSLWFDDMVRSFFHGSAMVSPNLKLGSSVARIDCKEGLFDIVELMVTLVSIRMLNMYGITHFDLAILSGKLVKIHVGSLDTLR